MYLEIPCDRSYRLLTGGPLIMIASRSAEGVADVMSCAWNCPFDHDEMMPVLDTSHTTVANILATGILTICIPSVDQGRTIMAVGHLHGRDCGDKFAATSTPSITGRNGIRVVPDCLAYLECELLNAELLRSMGLCHCRVVRAAVAEECWDREQEHFGAGMRRTVHHVTGSLLISGGELVSCSRSQD